MANPTLLMLSERRDERPNPLLSRTKRAWKSRTFGQAAGFAGSNAATNVIGAIAGALIARRVSTDEYGSYTFVTTFFLFAAAFFDFGLFLPGSRLAAVAEDDEEAREIFGATLYAFVPIGLAFMVCVFFVSFWLDDWFHVQAGGPLRFSILLVFIYPFAYLANQISQGLDKLHIYSWTLLLGHVLFFVVLVGFIMFGGDVNATSGVFLRTATFAVGWTLLVIWLKPRFKRARLFVPRLLQGAKRYGAQIFVGRLLTVGTYNMEVLFVAALTDAASVGFYTIARGLTHPIELGALGIASALFPRMTKEDSISPLWLAAAWGMGIAGAVIAYVLARPVIRILYSARYVEAADIVIPLALAAAVTGVMRLYNYYLSAKADARSIRNASILLTLCNVALMLLLTPKFGAVGAGWASFTSMVVALAAHIYFYYKVRDQPEKSPPRDGTGGLEEIPPGTTLPD